MNFIDLFLFIYLMCSKNFKWSAGSDEVAKSEVHRCLTTLPECEDHFTATTKAIRASGFDVGINDVRNRYQNHLSPNAMKLRNTPPRDWTIGDRARLLQLIGGRPLTRRSALLKTVSLKLERAAADVWRQYRDISTIENASQDRGVRRCHYRLAGVRCTHTSKDPEVKFYYLSLTANRRVLSSMGYSTAEVSKLIVAGHKRLFCCSCHQDGAPTMFALPGSRVCRHTQSSRRRLPRDVTVPTIITPPSTTARTPCESTTPPVTSTADLTNERDRLRSQVAQMTQRMASMELRLEKQRTILTHYMPIM